MKTVILNQPTGLGDILFCMGIANNYMEKGYKVIFPYDPVFGNLQPHFPYIDMPARNEVDIDYERKDCYVVEKGKYKGAEVLPLRWCNNGICNPDTMPAKYLSVGLPLELWRTLRWKRYYHREMRLWEAKRKSTVPYILINQLYHHTFQHVDIPFVRPTYEHEIIYMKRSMDYTLLDWCLLIEGAEEIHTVGTSILYMLDVLPYNKPVYVYKRPVDANHNNYNFLMQKQNYIYR